MFSAALALLVSGVGVLFGWQPLPGNTRESELVVQVAPESLERLAEGASIPLTADVPGEAGRVARVRLVIAGERQPLGRREETRLKPIGEPSTIVLTQYNEPAASRYGVPAPNYGAPVAAPQPIAQPLVAPPVVQTFDPYTQAPPQASAVAAATDWNSGADAAAGPLQRLGSGIQTAAQPLQDGVQRVGDGVRNLGQNIAGRADQLRDELGRPLQNGLFGGRTAQTATAAGTTGQPGVAAEWNNAPATAAPPWQGGVPQLGAPPTATAVAGTPAAESSWNDDGPPRGVGAFGTSGAPSTAPPFVGGAGNTGASTANTDRWANADDPRLRNDGGVATTPARGVGLGAQSGLGTQGVNGAPGGFGSGSGGFGNAGNGGALGNAGGGTAPGWNGGTGNTLPLPEPPSLTTTSGGFGQSGAFGQSSPAPGAAGGATGAPVQPIVRGAMLDLPGDRALEGTSTMGVGFGTTSGATTNGNTTTGIGGFPGAGAAGNAGQLGNAGATGNPGGSLLGSQGWATGGGAPAATLPTAGNQASQTQPGQSQPDGRQQAAVILAWVLLFASVASNMYLFWSYLDVRTKYRALVRKTARAVGSRFSAA